MKYISKLSVETIALLASIKVADEALKQAREQRDLVASTIKLPSGRNRNGGKKDLDDAQSKYDLSFKGYWDCRTKLSAHLRGDVMITRRQHITEILDVMIGHPNNNVVKDVIKAARACFVERAIQTIAIKGYLFDVNCDISFDGLMVNISPQGEGRSVCGGLVNVRRKNEYTYNRDIEQKLETITSVSVVGDELHVELPDEYRDSGYTISCQSRDDLEVDYARTVFFLFDACVDIANLFNCYIVESALSHATYKEIDNK
jgi:hypothetical protein